MGRNKNVNRTNHKLNESASVDFEPEWAALSQGWIGRGRIRGAVDGRAVVLRIDGLTTRGSAYRRPVQDFFRRELRLRPQYAGDFAVDIAVVTGAMSPRCDVDNVAKALLDALTGAVFRDDSQVSRLVVERYSGVCERIWLRAAPRGAVGGGGGKGT